MRRTIASLLLLIIGGACTSDNHSDVGPDAGVDGGVDGAVLPDASRPPLDASLRDLGVDASAPISCNTTCDCPQGLACLAGVCDTRGIAVWCCDKPCPLGATCLDSNESVGTCAGGDAGVSDAGRIGETCQADDECGTDGTCWQQNAPPFFWGGYCTTSCDPSCPSGSTCIVFGGDPALSGCMRDCVGDDDCRTDAYCLNLPGGANVCVPDCRDDLIDCAPRDGTSYCSRSSGRCEPTPQQTLGVPVGAPCDDNVDCAPGDICMGETAWGLPSGMCTHVCSDLPESTPCGSESTCQPFAGVGLCFRKCEAGQACPDRPGAVCAALDVSWTEPGCIGQ